MAKRQRRRRRERRQEHARRQGWQTRHSVLTGAGLAAGAALGLVSPAAADPMTFTVDNLNDPVGAGACSFVVANDCSLRQAITDANANPGPYDFVYFQAGLSGTISLTAAGGGQIPITDTLYMAGPGPNELAIDAAPTSRIFDLNPATAGDDVEIDGLRLTGGDVTGSGGAIHNDDAELTMFNAVLSGNTASVFGGAIYEAGNFSDGDDDYIGHTTFSDNHAGDGGAIFANTGWGVLRTTTFSGNSADNGYGGALDGVNGFLVDSTVSGNQATGEGGGGVIASNIYLYGTILANNTADANPDLDVLDGIARHDLVENPGTTDIGTVPTIITGQDPQLGALTLNGGDTPTLKPAAGSPVVDQSFSYYSSDQRGFDRLVDNPNRANVAGGNAADIGAVELTLAEGPQATPASPPPTQPVAPKKKCKKKHKRSAHIAKKKCKKKKKRSAASARGFRFHMPSNSGPQWPDGAHHPFRLGR